MSWNDLRKGRYSHVNYSYFVTCTVSGRRPVFKDDSCAQIMQYCIEQLEEEKQLHWYGWVIMPDHIHGLCSLLCDDLSKTMKLLKGRSARALNELMQDKGQVWQPGYYDHGLRQDEAVEPIVNYIINNPVRAGLVEKSEQWPWLYSRYGMVL